MGWNIINTQWVSINVGLFFKTISIVIINKKYNTVVGTTARTINTNAIGGVITIVSIQTGIIMDGVLYLFYY